MDRKLSPSMMCVDYMSLGKTLETFALQGISFLHMDVMDGRFVPNFALGTDFCRKIRKACTIPLDLHLMVERPEEKLDWFSPQEGEIVSVHWESTNHMQRLLTQIRGYGAKAFVALNPATPFTVLDYLLDVIDGVLVMTVNPGFAGQKLVPSTLRKITDLRAYLDTNGRKDCEIEVDGNVSFENIPKMRDAGANIFVGGTSSVFHSGATLAENIARIKELLQ